MAIIQPSLRDFGNSKLFPALKRRAIVIASLCDGQTPIAPIVHPKMNTGKEPFKCGMESAECGVRRNLISIIAQHRAPRPVK
jgi:hypothetical protein